MRGRDPFFNACTLLRGGLYNHQNPPERKKRNPSKPPISEVLDLGDGEGLVGEGDRGVAVSEAGADAGRAGHHPRRRHQRAVAEHCRRTCAL